MRHSVPASEAIEASRGMLQKRLYIVFTTPVDGMDKVLANLPEHLAFQVDLERRGIMFGAGPMFSDDEQEWSGEGMVVIRAACRAEAIAIAESDPMHRAGARSFRVRRWLLNEGTITLRVNFSDGSREIL